jgi:hypothetical protein
MIKYKMEEQPLRSVPKRCRHLGSDTYGFLSGSLYDLAALPSLKRIGIRPDGGLRAVAAGASMPGVASSISTIFSQNFERLNYCFAELKVHKPHEEEYAHDQFEAMGSNR